MIVASQTRSHTRLLAGMTVAGVALLLTGCEFEPHDSITKPPSSMPVPASVQAEQAKSAQQGHSGVPVPTDKEMGMPVYPNAIVYVDPTGLAIKPDIGVEFSTATLTTSDPMDRVVDFYKKSLVQTDGQGKTSPASAREETENGQKKSIIHGNDSDGNIMMAIIHANNGQTVMELMHTHMRAIPSSVSGTSDSSTGTSTHAGDLPSTSTGSTGGSSTNGSTTGGSSTSGSSSGGATSPSGTPGSGSSPFGTSTPTGKTP